MSQFKHLLYSQFAKIAKALSHPHRLELLEFLAQREHSVESLAEVSGLSYANCSQHLQQLKAVGLAASRKQGLYVYYSIKGSDVVEAMGLLAKLARHNLAEVDRLVERHLSDKDDLEPITSAELIERLKQGEVTLIDVRPADEYHAGHIAGAVNVSIDDLEAYVKQHQALKEVVAYCRGPYCVLSFEAVNRLRALGVTSHRLEEGFPEWEVEGLPVER